MLAPYSRVRLTHARGWRYFSLSNGNTSIIVCYLCPSLRYINAVLSDALTPLEGVGWIIPLSQAGLLQPSQVG